MQSASQLTAVYQNMQISKFDFEHWYGDPMKANKMQGADLAKKYYSGLR